MRTLIRATSKAQRSFVPIIRFTFENFRIRMRHVSGHRPSRVGVACGRLKSHFRSRFKNIRKPIHAAQPAKIFLPSALLQGHGLMYLRLGARLVVHPAALPSSASANLCSQADETCATWQAMKWNQTPDARRIRSSRKRQPYPVAE
jgi:hypothetical protein